VNDQGIRQLWASVISQAICDIDLRGDRVVRAQAARWINSDSQMSRSGRKSLTGKLFSRRALEKRVDFEEESRDLSFDFYTEGQ